MNNSYKLVYSEALNTWVAVAEHVSARGKKSAVRLVTAAALLAGGAVGTGWALAAPPLITPPAVNQLPTGGQVAAGTVNISQTQTATAANMAIQQNSNQAIVNWQSFNLGANAKVDITQPSSSSVLLNRVMSSNPSQIFGQVNANGQVFLSNPNGVYFAPGSSVDVGSFTATTHSISDADFLAGKYNFNRNGATGSITNEGSITSGLGGYIALLAPEVRNQGVVVAKVGGTVAMAAGESYQLQFNSNSQLTNVLVTPSTVETLIENGNAVQVPGGLIILSVQAASSLLGGVVKNSGSISATGLVNDGGTIRLSASNKIELASTSSISADAAPNSAGNGGRIDIIADLNNATGTTQVDGSISAKGGEQGGDGGFVDTSGALLTVAETARVNMSASLGTAGTWLLDPYDITIAGSGSASGTSYSTTFTAGATSTILASVISSSLDGGTSVSISTGSASSNTIYVNSAITATTGSASLTLIGGTINLAANITTKGSQTYTGAVVLNNAAGITLTSTNSNINFGSTVNSSNGNYYGLTVSNGTGTTAFGGVVGGTNPLGYLCINVVSCSATSAGTASSSGTTTLAGNVTTSGTQTYGGNLTLGANTALTSTANGGNGAVTIAGNVTTTLSISNGILQFLGSGNWKYSVNGGTSWAYYSNSGSGNTYVAGSSSTTSAPSSLSFTISYSGSTYTYTPNSSISGAQILLVGGGAAGGNSNAPATGGGGGGGVVYVPSATLSGAYSVLVGSGGAGASGGYGSPGGNSLFNLSTNPTGYQITANGGGGGAGAFGDSGAAGGSGGGGHWTTGNGGAATQGSVTGFSGATLSGNSGGASNRSGTAGGGGGGASAAGTAGSGSKVGGNGGNGISYSITGGSVVYGSGGGGMGESGSGTGGTNAGNAGIYNGAGPGNGVVNTGGGGGGGFNTQGSGGSGVVVVSGAMDSIQGAFALTINSGTGKSFIGGSVSNVSTSTINSTSALSEITGVISGSTALVKSGAGGVLTLSGTNTHTGGTTISGGTLKLGNAGALGSASGAVSVTGGAAMDLNGITMTSTNTLTLSGTGISDGGALTNSSSTAGTYAGNVVLASASSIGSSVGEITASGVISGNFALTKVGAATLSLTGSNSYTGTTTISAGTLKAGHSAAFGNSNGGAILVEIGGALDLNGNSIIRTNTLTLNGTGVLSGGALTNSSSTPSAFNVPVVLGSDTSIGSSSGSVNLTGVISGAGNLTKIGSANSTFSGINTYTGTTTVSGSGILAISTAQGLGSTDGGTIVSSTGRLLINGLSVGAEAITLNGGSLEVTSGTTSLSGPVTLGANSSVRVDSGAQLTLSGLVDGTGSLTKSPGATGTLVLTGTNTYSGGTTISAGTLQLGAGGTTGSIQGNVSNTGTLAFNRSDDLTYANVISGSGAVTKLAANTLTFTGTNTYTGGTTISAGTLQIGAGSTTGSITGDVTNNATFALNLSGALSFSGAISGTGSVTKLGTGTTTLSGVNTYIGLTTVSTGTLAITNAYGLGGTAAGTTVASGATLDLQGVAVGAEAITLQGGTLATTTGTSSLSGAVTLAADSTINVAGSASQLTISGLVTGASKALTKSGTGNLILTARNTFSGGMTIAAGTATEGTTYDGTSGPLGSGTVYVPTGGTLDTNAYNIAVLVSLGGGSLVNNSTVVQNGAGDISAGVTLTANSIFGGVGKLNAWTQIQSNGYGLAFVGSGYKNLSNTSNTLTSIASGAGVGQIDVTNNQNLTIGSVTVGSTPYTGLSSTGTILVKTITGNLTVNNNVVTSSTSSNASSPAIELAAGYSDATTSTTNNLILASSASSLITAGSGAAIALYSGTPTSSSYLSEFATGQTTKSITYSKTTSNRPSASAGYYVMYRGSQPNLYVIYSSSGSSTYGSAPNVTYTFNTLADGSGNSYISTDTSTLSVTGTALFKGTYAPTGTTNVSLNASANAGNYTAVTYLSGLSSPIYTLTAGTGTGTFTINKANAYVIVTTGQSSTYGTSPTLSYSFNTSSAGTGTPISASPAGLSGSALITNAPTATSDAGTYSLSYASGLSSTNYEFNGAASATPYTVNQAQAFVIINAGQFSTYGSVPSIGYTFNTNSAGTGSSIDASPAGLSGTATITNAPTSTSNAGGTYNITYASGLTSTNYAFFGAASPRSYTVNKAPLNLAISKVYDGTTSLTNANTYTFSGTRYNGDAAPTITSGSASTLSANAATYTSFSTNSFVLSNNNYTLTGGTVAATIDPKTVSVTNAARSTTYNGVTNYNTLANGASYSVGTMVGSDSVASVTQTPSGFIGSATGTAQAGTLTVTPSAAVLGTGTASNYTFSYVPSTHTVEKANLSVSATPSLTGNVYNGNAFTGTYTTTAVNGETFTVTGQATGTNAGTYTSALNVSGAALANYNTPAISNANLVISPKPVTLTNTSRSTTYDGVSNYTTLANGASYSVGTMVGSDSVASVTQTPSGFIGSATGTAQAGTLTVTPSAAVLGTGTASNYTFSYVPSTHTVEKANLSVSATPSLTGNVYNGNAFTGTYTTTAVNGETFTVTGQATGTNAGTYTSALNVSGAALANYNTPAISNANLVISRKPASIANVARSTSYDGLSTNSDLANGMTYTVSGLVGFDAVSSVTQTPGNSVLASSVANAGSFTVTPSAAVMSTGLVSNYEFSYGSALASVSKVNLSVIANNGGKFVGESDNSAYDGVSYRGFVAGETASVLSGAVVISRSNLSVNAPGTYTGVLSAMSSTLSSNNYNISYEAGSYTIVPADQLLIRLTNTTTSYGTAPSYTLSSVQYKSSTANAVVDLTSRAAVNTSAFTLSDGAGGSTSLTLGPLSSTLSSAGQVAVGSYQVGAASITNTSANYSNTVNIVGSLTVDPKSVTATASAGLGKAYDGTTTMGGLGLGLNGLVGADAVSATGLGTYANANAGNNKSFSVTGIQLAGTDASNYKLASNTLSASTGVITQASLLIKAQNDSKSYNASAYSSANAAVAGVNYSGFVNGETASALGGSLTFGGTAIGAVNVGNYVIEPSGLTSNNYAITYGNGALNISPANVSVSATNVSLTGTVSKVYDGTNVATLAPSNYVMTGWQGSDGATIAQTVGTYDNANAGSNKLVNVTLTSNDYTAINGTLLSNYNLPTAVSGYVGLVVPKLVTVANAARTTTYDGVTNYNTLASGTTFTVSAMVGSDTLSSVTQTPTGFGSSASGTAQGGTFTVTPSAAVLSTGAVSNYSFSFVSSTHSVDRVNLSVTANNATKTYDGVVYAGGNGVSYNGFVNNETSAVLGGTLGYAGSSQNAKNVGNYVITPNGLTSSNYTMSFVDGSLTITPAGLNAIVASLTGSTSKVYDGNTAATLTPGNFAFSGFATGEGASVSKTTGTFDNANAGNNKTVTVSLSSSDMAANSGTLLSNYTLPTSATGAIGTITKAPLSVTASNASKTYDGAVFLGGNGVNYSGFVNNETSAVLGGTLGYAGTSQNAKNASNYVITPNGLTSSNYTMSFVDGSLTITPAGLNAIVASLTGSTSKVYDGNTAATLTPGNFAFSGFATGEGASVSKTTGTFDNANAGNNKTVTVSLSSSDMAANSGTLLSNYTLPTSASGAIGTITPANLILTALTNTKNFDGKTDAQAIPTVSGLKGSDTVSNLSEAYADANPGTGKTLNVQAGYQISDGNQGRNYSVTLVPNQTGEIRAQAVAVLPPVAPSASISSYSPPTLTLYAASGSAASASSASSSSGASSSVSVGSSSGVVVNTINSPTTQVTGLVAVLVPAGTATTGTGLVIALPQQVLTSAGPNSSVQVTLPNNEPLPAWIRYDAATQTLVTTAVPSGGFPLSVVVTVGGQSTIIQISETKNNP